MAIESVSSKPVEAPRREVEVKEKKTEEKPREEKAEAKAESKPEEAAKEQPRAVA